MIKIPLKRYQITSYLNQINSNYLFKSNLQELYKVINIQ